MAFLNKKRMWKFLRVSLYTEDWEALKRQADKEHLSLATWVRQKLLQLTEGRSFSED